MTRNSDQNMTIQSSAPHSSASRRCRPHGAAAVSRFKILRVRRLIQAWKNILGSFSGARVPQRWIFAVMGSLAITNVNTMRNCLSMAITDMVKRNVTLSNATVSAETCPSFEPTISIPRSSGTYEWSEYTQGIILSSYAWGNVATQVPAGLLTQKIGGKYTLGMGLLLTAIFTILTPFVVHAYDSTGLIVLRVLMGASEGSTYPAISALLAQWAPPNERTKIGTVVTSGAALGGVLANAVSGVLIEHSSIGWPIVFYFFGGATILWFLAWVVLCYNKPDEHPFISAKEKKYLHESMNRHTHDQTHPIPWRHILTSVPVWALILGQISYLWSFFTLSTDLPKYMSSVMKFSIKTNGFLTALPYILKLVVSIGLSCFADWLIKSGRVSRTNVRKIWFTGAMIIPAICIIAASYAGCDRTVVVVFFTIAVTMMGGNFSSILLNPADLSPIYAGPITSIVNGLGSMAGILAPYVIGVLTPNQTVSEWRLVFWITFIFSWSTTLIFDLWAQGEVQSWNNPNFKAAQMKDVEVEMEVELKLMKNYPQN